MASRHCCNSSTWSRGQQRSPCSPRWAWWTPGYCTGSTAIGGSRHWRANRTPAPRPCSSVQVRHTQSDCDLVFLAVERAQRRAVVTHFRPHDGIGPGADVERRGAAAELLASVRWEADHSVERTARAVLVVDVVTPQRQAERGAEVIRDPHAKGPPLGILGRIGEGLIGPLLSVVAL